MNLGNLGGMIYRIVASTNTCYYSENQLFVQRSQYTQYPIIRNGDQSWALEFLKNFQFKDAGSFLILQGLALAVS